MSASQVAKHIDQVRAKIAAACVAAGRRQESVKLIAVSKTKPISLIDEAVAATQMSFGENYVQEASEKIALRPDLDWHFIGSLQSNKAKQVAGKFALVHSVDRLKMAQALNLAAELVSRVQPVLLQIYIGDEATKHGFSIDELPDALSQLSSLKGLSLRGLMALPPLEEDVVKSRENFAQLRYCLEASRKLLAPEQRAAFSELSMGTSSDYEAAILEGATLVRVGTEIFGARS